MAAPLLIVRNELLKPVKFSLTLSYCPAVVVVISTLTLHVLPSAISDNTNWMGANEITSAPATAVISPFGHVD